MALCSECNADYLPHIAVCPACGLELAPGEPPPPVQGDGFVPFLTAGYPEGMAAAASLEAAGLETRLTTMDFHVYLATPLHVTVMVRERDLDAAAAALRKPPPPPPPRCLFCGDLATVHEGEADTCAFHASGGSSVEPCDTPSGVDEDVSAPVDALNARPDVRTLCSCSGSHPGAREGFISIGPSGDGEAATAQFDAFLALLQKRIDASPLAGRIGVVWSAEHGAEINLVDRARARETWLELAALVKSL